jgi:hypothetical protein
MKRVKGETTERKLMLIWERTNCVNGKIQFKRNGYLFRQSRDVARGTFFLKKKKDSSYNCTLKFMKEKFLGHRNGEDYAFGITVYVVFKIIFYLKIY